ncbi:hypothetical protein DR_B0047 (plasmid) [Deinococcus radiodurans R1 = ATCC 13939 = DSM 20539]|uniref:Uncharacterized protein n=1 Tax=Deinococcus radiodurans (strain ATCC 13939 / DSM 20539 / JCM 16871 / CCUG 27074 / LMG 4051 / NBRC 15346 / NCIMB 9279 / VKM B-1422 / R1) TaxID=243230 RepID=Q9RZR8_DEIRA|nr:hypothetical protein DR_B0047 [Deinococcus radiodurans R1 = ATCC 13939 = DSM 20539]ANC73186.1 hypothetical protein A2G07_15090 [Deinococcus radiodurans R1 = ATCC 13939 = DSM 20539]
MQVPQHVSFASRSALLRSFTSRVSSPSVSDLAATRAVLRITRASEEHRHPLHSLLRSFASPSCSVFCTRSARQKAVPSFCQMLWYQLTLPVHPHFRVGA